MHKLNFSATYYKNADVIAHTGDCVSTTHPCVPREWDEWPQKTKLSVPGNHDKANTYEVLKKWKYAAPWFYRCEDVLFIGLDLLSRNGINGLTNVPGAALTGAKAVILLTHERPMLRDGEPHFIPITEFIADRKLLVLHGHEHPNDFRGLEWDTNCRLAGRAYWRSAVCSSTSGRRGCINCIDWSGGIFRLYEEIR